MHCYQNVPKFNSILSNTHDFSITVGLSPCSDNARLLMWLPILANSAPWTFSNQTENNLPEDGSPICTDTSGICSSILRACSAQYLTMGETMLNAFGSEQKLSTQIVFATLLQVIHGARWVLMQYVERAVVYSSKERSCTSETWTLSDRGTLR